MRKSDLRRIVFDSAFFAYTAALAIYPWISPSQEEFIAQFDRFNRGMLLVLLSSFVLASLAARLSWPTVGQILFAAESTPQDKSLLRKFWVIHLAIVFIGTLAVSIQVTEASLVELLDADGLAGAWRLWKGLADPNFNLLAKAVAEVLETIYIAFLATVIAIPIAFVLAFLCAKNIMNNPVAFAIYGLLRLLMNVSRSVEPLIWALIFTVWVGVGPFAGMLALMIHSVASLTKYYSEILEAVDDKPIDGVRSTGASQIQVVWYAIVPQIILPYIGMTIYRWDTNVRMATVIGLVGGGGIGTLLIQYQGQAMWPEVGCIILVIAFVVWLMDVASAYVREALK